MSTVMKARKLTPKQEQKMVAGYVERVYAECCTGPGKVIGIMDIGKVFAAGASALLTAIREHRDSTTTHDAVVAAMTSAFEQYRVRS